MVQSVTASFKGASEGAYRLYIEDYLRLIISLIPLVNFRNFGAGALFAFYLNCSSSPKSTALFSPALIPRSPAIH